MVAFAAGLGALAVLQHRAFWTGRFDVGNLVQAVWSTAHGDVLSVTGLTGRQISRLGAHFDPIVVVFAPLWWLWPDPSLLLVSQALAVATGAVPVYLLGKRHLGSDWAAAGFALAYLLHPATQWLVLDDFHPVALATPLLLWAFWFLDAGRLLAFAPVALAACLTKEQIGLVVAAMGLWYALRPEGRRAGIAIALAGAAISVVAVTVVVPHFAPGGGSPFEGGTRRSAGRRRASPRPPSPTPVRSWAPRPTAATSHTSRTSSCRCSGSRCSRRSPRSPRPRSSCSTSSPTRARRRRSTSTTPQARSRGCSSPRSSAPRGSDAGLPGYAALTGVPSSSPRSLRASSSGRCPSGGSSRSDRTSPRASTSSTSGSRDGAGPPLVPADAPVSATNTLGAHLSERRRVFSFPVLGEAEWVAVDRLRPSYRDEAVAPLRFAAALARLEATGRFVPVFDEDGILVLRRRA